ncbi:hypothetical protein [Oceanospirillum sediminis]|uniref:Uncharacterized protein n=1 Tax=Oceanospirillum sediminis TaxID=2760088 RepID=A0A839IW96_9GAMM|nr:hypothetical protein [Oceanospirillum sediminis]MBB1489228.1 hypothetical protein [Oceanospirillum sediminis]
MAGNKSEGFCRTGSGNLSGTESDSLLTKNDLAEGPLQGAPVAILSNGHCQIPQQFYEFSHTLGSVEALLDLISFSEHFPVFSGEDTGGIYIQVGIIGYENYPGSGQIREKKIVYGRKWRVEENLPTSEIIQTVFLALKKAREHEVRELFTLKSASEIYDKERSCTPFNNHHDLPLMQFADLLPEKSADFSEQEVKDFLKRIRFGLREITLIHYEQRHNGDYLMDFRLGVIPDGEIKLFPEYDNREISVLISEPGINAVLYGLMDQLLAISERYVEERFRFNGFARFSRTLDVQKIGAFSVQTRCFDQQKISAQFNQDFRQMCGEVDRSRVPALKTDAQKRRLNPILQQARIKEGFLPEVYGVDIAS